MAAGIVNLLSALIHCSHNFGLTKRQMYWKTNYKTYTENAFIL